MALLYEELSSVIWSVAIEVHTAFGPGLLETVYERAMARELEIRGVPFLRQVQVPVVYKGEIVEVAFRVDLLVDDRIVVEVKAIEALLPIHQAQLMTYLRLSDKRLGFLINFNVERIKDGVKRIAMG